MVLSVYGPSVGTAAPMSHPHAAAGAQKRIEGGHHAAGWRHALDTSPYKPMLIRFAVGNQDQAMLLQLTFNQFVERLFGPHVCLRVNPTVQVKMRQARLAPATGPELTLQSLASFVRYV
jgi:hypothetical protein